MNTASYQKGLHYFCLKMLCVVAQKALKKKKKKFGVYYVKYTTTYREAPSLTHSPNICYKQNQKIYAAV